MSSVQQDIPPGQADTYLLDLFSTSPTNREFAQCEYHAPYVCVPPDGKPGMLYQTCCNHWDCCRCGEMRARHEYGRIVEGARTLAKEHDLYFLTITCPGDMPLDDAEKQYLTLTNRFLDALRNHVKRAGGHWAYAAVTERQKRGHPHSHLLTTFAPNDVFAIIDDYGAYQDSVARINASVPLHVRFTATPKQDVSLLDMHSEWLMLAAFKAGLGVQARISIVDSPEACSRYIAKYLFKQTVSDIWPEGWKRVRYSQSWPKLPEAKTTTAFPVLTASDWQRVKLLAGTIECHSEDVYRRALLHECTNVLCTVENSLDVQLA